MNYDFIAVHTLASFQKFYSFFTINICWKIVRLPWSVIGGLILAVGSAVGRADDRRS
jgi:hypothetical protein